MEVGEDHRIAILMLDGTGSWTFNFPRKARRGVDRKRSARPGDAAHFKREASSVFLDNFSRVWSIQERSIQKKASA